MLRRDPAPLYVEPLGEAVTRERPDGPVGERPDGRTLLGRLVAWSMEPPRRFAMKTYDQLKPGEALDPDALADEFAALHAA